MTAMDDLNQLVTLKRAATNIRGLDAYVASLYRCTTAWGGGVTVGVAALVYDGLIDTLAHEDLQEATGADLRAERAFDTRRWENAVPKPADGRTG